MSATGRAESQSRLILDPAGNLTKEQIAGWIPAHVTRNGGLRDLVAEMLALRYASTYPMSYAALGHKYGVSRARIHQIMTLTLKAMAKESFDQIPPGTRLSRAVERFA